MTVKHSKEVKFAQTQHHGIVSLSSVAYYVAWVVGQYIYDSITEGAVPWSIHLHVRSRVEGIE